MAGRGPSRARRAPCPSSGPARLSGPLDARAILHLQKAAGNAAVAGLLALQREVKEPALEDRREQVEEIIGVLARGAAFYRAPRVTLDAARFERAVQGWFVMVTAAQTTIDDHLDGEPALTRRLHSAYTAAIRALLSQAAVALRRPVGELYNENSGRIPMWAWATPHHRVPGISTPIREGLAADVGTGEVRMIAGDFRVTVAPDAEDRRLGRRAETHIDTTWGPAITFKSERRGKRKIVVGFNRPAQPSARITTFYGPGTRAEASAWYGRGTTAQDVAGGKVDRRSITTGFHEGSHGLDYVEFMQSNPAPVFTGRIGMTSASFKAAIAAYRRAGRAYVRALYRWSARTDCVGITIDRWGKAHARKGAKIVLVCPR